MYSLKKKSTVLALGATLSLGLAACSDDSGTDSTGSDTSTSGTESSTPESSPSPVAAIDAVDGVDTSVMLDAGFVEGITGLGLTPGVTGGAQFDAGTGTVSFPITGGDVEYFEPGSVETFVQGELQHEGSGLTLSAEGGPMVELSDFVVDPDESVLTGTVSVDGMEAVASAPLFNLDGSDLQPLEVDMENGTAVLTPVTATLTSAAADLLNQTFMVDALSGGFPVGTATVTLMLPAS